MKRIKPGISICSVVAALTAFAPASSGAATHGLTGLGATKTAWTRAHVRDSRQCPGHACFGYPVSGVGVNGYEFSVDFFGGRVEGWEGSFLGHTSIASAESAVLKQLPPDTTPVSFISSAGCAFWNLHSATIANVLGPNPWGDTNGDIGVEFLYVSPDGVGSYRPNNVNSDNVQIVQYSTSEAC